MADVFLSYSRRDQQTADLVARLLSDADFSVFSDRDLVAGDSYERRIQHELAEAKAVVALWSNESVNSAWVHDEAFAAVRENKLVPILIEQVELPLGFGQIHAINFIGWRGDSDASEWRLLIDALNRLVRGGRAPPRTATPRKRTNASRSYDSDTVAQSVDEVGAQVAFEKSVSYKKPWRAGATSVFVAHASGDKPRIKPIVEVLAGAGFRIWIDKPHLLGLDAKLAKRVRGIEFGPGDWRDQIRNAAHRAHIVLAFWSNDAIDARREQFYYEVYMGLIQRKLCQCRIDDMLPSKIGMPFTFDQIADLSNFERGAYHPELDFVMQALPKFKKRVF